MVFNSITFLVFFLSFFLLYWTIICRLPLRYRNLFILIASYIFYGWWDWRFLSLIIFSSVFDFMLGLKIDNAPSLRARNLFISFSLLINLGILGFFKYYNFFVDSFFDLFSHFSIHLNKSTLKIILPVGISFYTFQSLSYTIDVYRKQLKPTKDLIAFFAFVAFFPQLVAGPIERAKNLLPQFHVRKEYNHSLTVAGFRMALWGLFKKIVIADNLGLIVDRIFDPAFHGNVITIIVGTFLFSFQIYCDFSGYSDIAIGIAKTLGFELMDNFHTPYFSKSFTEFWRRWHISLSTWFRDYVYIPLGGNKKGSKKTFINLFITFVLSGLWHGANINYMLWGALHGSMLIIEKKFKLFKNGTFRSLIVFIIVSIFWLPFRAKDMHHLLTILQHVKIASVNIQQLPALFTEHFGMIKSGLLSLVFIIFLWIESRIGTKDFNTWIGQFRQPVRVAFYYSLVFIILLLVNFDIKPYFIYFQF
jgi:alginate O-acetyltransferase complex protein AlgI